MIGLFGDTNSIEKGLFVYLSIILENAIFSSFLTPNIVLFSCEFVLMCVFSLADISEVRPEIKENSQFRVGDWELGFNAPKC